MSSGDDSIYDPFDKLIRIQIEGGSFAVPENNTLLRCVQFIVDEGVVLGRFCWNNECGNCEVTLQTADHPEPKRARGCQTLVQAGMILCELTPDLRYWLHQKIDEQADEKRARLRERSEPGANAPPTAPAVGVGPHGTDPP